MNSLTTQDWFQALIDDCSSIITERVWRAKMEIIEGKHELGTRIIQEVPTFERNKIYGQKIVQVLAESLQIGVRSLYNVIEFVNKYPDLEKFLSECEEGKSISWNKIVTRYLPESPKESKKRKKLVRIVCPNCDYEFDYEIL